MKKMLLMFCIPLMLVGCVKKDVELMAVEEAVQEDTVTFSTDHAYNLNVIYFVPTNNPAKPEYERRLSEIMLSAQTYYGNQMQLNGYGFKTFGLWTRKNKTRIKIITIPAKYTYDKYTTANLSGILAEVNAYFAAHPGEKSGDHNLIIQPSIPGGVGNPYVGSGKNCFWPDRGEEVTSTTGIGGLMHELGHGLNLDHNRQRESRINDPNYGTSLMGTGNGTYGISPTFLTEADCAILNTNQIFQTTTSITYYGAVTARVRRMNASYSATKGAIIAAGKFNSSVPVTNVTFYLDPNYGNEGVGVNNDYNAVTWSTNVIGTDSFYVELPMNEMNNNYKGNNPAELKVKLIHQDGNITNTTYNFNFLNNIPVINIVPSQFDKSDWTVIDFSSQESVIEYKPASYMIDEDNNSFWFAKHSSPAAVLPHHVTIDLSRSLTVDGFTILLRSGAYRAVKDVEILTSSDNQTWTSAGNFVVPKVSTESRIPFGTTKTFRYFKIVVKSNYDTAEPNKSCIAELGLYKN